MSPCLPRPRKRGTLHDLRLFSMPSRYAGAIRTWRSTPTLQHSNTPTLQPSNTPTLQHSITPSLHHSITPSLHHSITPSLRAAGFEDEDDDEDEDENEAPHDIKSPPSTLIV